MTILTHDIYWTQEKRRTVMPTLELICQTLMVLAFFGLVAFLSWLWNKDL